MQMDKHDDSDPPRSAGSNPGDSGSHNTAQPDSKLRDKLQKLAEWRLDLASIEFPEDAREFRGGYATVSRAVLVSTSGPGKRADNLPRTGGKDKSDDGNTRRETVAVKKLMIEDEKDKERVVGLALREAGFLTELSHENIVKLEGFVEDMSEDRVWLVFPWADNGNLKDFVASEEWEIPERISLMNDVTQGVEYLHTRDPPIYHGDLKSPALLLEATFREATNTITLTGNKYTLRWAAPELLVDEGPGPWSDIWSLGWIFFEVITNHIPFEDVPQGYVVITRIVHGNLPSITNHDRVKLIQALHSLMGECWSIDPNKRPKAEDCRKSMTWMPMTIPEPHQTSNSSASRALSSDLLLQLGHMHALRNDSGSALKNLTQAGATETQQLEDAASNLESKELSPEIYVRASDFLSKSSMILESMFRTKVDALNRELRVFSVLGPSDNDDTNFDIKKSEFPQILERRGNDALLTPAGAHLALNEHSKAAAVHSKATQTVADSHNGKRRADALLDLAEVHRIRNEDDEAGKFYSEAIQLHAEIGNRNGRADALWGLAEVHRLQKQYTQASKLFSEALPVFTDVGDGQGRATTLLCLAEIHRHHDKHNDAIPLYEQAAGIFKQVGPLWAVARVLNLAASSRRELGPAGPTSTEELRKRRLARFGGQ